MGAWGPHSFENDAAGDFLADLGPLGPEAGVGAIARALEAVMHVANVANLDADRCSVALAAADLVASALNTPRAGEDDGVVAIAAVFAEVLKTTTGIADLARNAVLRATSGDAELYQLWHEDSAAGDTWDDAISDLFVRLRDANTAYPGTWTLSEPAPTASSEPVVDDILARLVRIEAKLDQLIEGRA